MTDHPVILFDGVCGLCHRAVRFVMQRDAMARFRFVPLQSPLGRSILQRHGRDPDRLDSLILVENGKAFDYSEAALRIARGLGGPWVWLAGLGRLMPRGLRDAAYRRIARTRYARFGRLDACPLPPPEWRDRFLD